VAAHPLGAAAAAFLFDRLEHVGHLTRVVSRTGQNLRAEDVGLPLVLAAVLHQLETGAHLRAGRQHLAEAAAEDRAGNLADRRADRPLLARGRLGGAVTQRHVRNLVRHHAGHLGFRLRLLDHAAIEEHRSAGQGERVDLLLVHDVERVAEPAVAVLGRDRLHQPATHVLDVVVHALVVQQRELFLDLVRRFLAKLHIVLDRVGVPRRDDLRLRGGGPCHRERKDYRRDDPAVASKGHWCSHAKG
jgi:hypothetical protein